MYACTCMAIHQTERSDIDVFEHIVYKLFLFPELTDDGFAKLGKVLGQARCDQVTIYNHWRILVQPSKRLRIHSNKKEGIIGDYINPGIRQPNPLHLLNETKHYECMMCILYK